MKKREEKGRGGERGFRESWGKERGDDGGGNLERAGEGARSGRENGGLPGE